MCVFVINNSGIYHSLIMESVREKKLIQALLMNDCSVTIQRALGGGNSAEPAEVTGCDQVSCRGSSGLRTNLVIFRRRLL